MAYCLIFSPKRSGEAIRFPCKGWKVQYACKIAIVGPSDSARNTRDTILHWFSCFSRVKASMPFHCLSEPGFPNRAW